MAHANNVLHFAIHADDLERAREFYEQVFGWRFEDWGPPDFYRVHTGSAEDQGIAGADYGWPQVEGPDPPGVPNVTYPIFSYNHNGAGASIIAGDFMTAGNFTPEYEHNFFYADFTLWKIFRLVLDPSGLPVSNEEFATNTISPVHVRTGPDGALYYASITSETIYRIGFVGGSNRQPIAVASAAPTDGLSPLSVQFDGSGSSDPDSDPITFLWDFGDSSPTSTLAAPLHSYGSDGVYTATLEVSDGQATRTTPVPIVVGNRGPTATILGPAGGSSFDAGQTVNFSGSATDPEDGLLGAAVLSWTVLFHHNTHFHPFLGPVSGIAAGSFLTEDSGETATDVWYEIIMTASDSGAPLGPTGTVTDTQSVSIFPNLSTMTFATAPRTDLPLLLDGAGIQAPQLVQGVVGVKRPVEAPSSQTPGDGHTYVFSSWSDGGARTHTVVTPAADTTLTATYACDIIEEVADLEVSREPSGDLTLTWTAPSDPCLSSGPVIYHVYAAATAIPSSPPGSFPTDPTFVMIAPATGSSVTFTPSAGTEYFLVAPVGSDAGDGPIGHYGQ